MGVVIDKNFKQVVADESLIKNCVGTFDQGFDYVYVTNEKGQFLGQAVTVMLLGNILSMVLIAW